MKEITYNLLVKRYAYEKQFLDKISTEGGDYKQSKEMINHQRGAVNVLKSLIDKVDEVLLELEKGE